MSFGAGHIQDMINRIRQNRAQRPSAKAKFKEHNREVIYSDVHTTQLRFKNVSLEALTKIKKQIQVRARQERRTESIIYITVTGVLAIAFFFFLGI